MKKMKLTSSGHGVIPATGEAEAGGLQVQEQPELYGKIISQNKKIKEGLVM
jgi:hypothetical protein